MPKEGLEPSRPCGHWILNPTRLPIPPLRPVMRKIQVTGLKLSHRGSAATAGQEFSDPPPNKPDNRQISGTNLHQDFADLSGRNTAEG